MNFKKSDNEMNMSFPLQESFSNTSPNRQNPINLLYNRCPTHPRFELTNICISQGCLEPLCPECVKHHIKLHQELNSECKAESLFSMRETCLENVQGILNEFVNEKQRLHSWLDKKVFPHEEILLKIKQAKENLLNMILKFFEFIEKNVNSFVMSYKSTHQEEFNHLSNKINALIDELQGMQIELNSAEYIKCILKRLTQGFSTDLEVLKKEISDAFEAWETNSHNYEIDDTKLYSINLELMKYIKMRESKPGDSKTNRPNILSNERNRLNLNRATNKENLNVQDKFKNFQNYLEYTMKSPSKIRNKASEMGIDTAPNQKEFMDTLHNLNHPLISGQINLEFSQENRLKFDVPNYFSRGGPQQFLCFFQDNSKKFHYLDLASLENQDIKPKFIEKDLLIDFKIPLYHRSIITPNGDVFITGGIDPNHRARAINKFYQMDIKIPSLIAKTPMGQARYSHSLCFAEKYIFVAGGVDDINDGYLNSFEKYDIDFGEWIPLSPCPSKSIGSAICNFKDKLLYKFGGKMDNTGFTNYIERYEIGKNEWAVLLIQCENQIFKMPSFMNACQINNDEIMVYGGNINETQCRLIFLLRVKEFIKNDQMYREERFREIKMEINAPGSFWIQPIIHEKVLFNVQNLQIEKGKELCHFGKKRALICNSEIWKDL